MSLAHRCGKSPSLTDLFFPVLETAANKSGAKRHSGPNGDQLSVHSLAEDPDVFGAPTPAAGDEEDDPESMERLLERTHAITVDEHREFGAGNLQLF